jgi:hypothetical protein
MLTRQGAWWLTALALVALEPASWMTSQVPPCVVNPANYGDDYAQNNECPPFHVFVAMPRVLATIGHEWLVALAAIATAVFTATLWWSTRKLWQATRNTALAQERDTKILQRAYIAVAPRGIHLLLPGDKLIGHVAITNAGNLPARDVSWFIDIKISASGEEADFPLKGGAGKIVISPRAEAVRGSAEYVVLQTVLAAAGDTPDKARQKPVYLYVWGIVEYHDGFTGNRTTKFCHRYNWINQGRAGSDMYEISQSFARYHEHGNDAD